MTLYCGKCYQAVNKFKDPVPHDEIIKMKFVGRGKIPNSHGLFMFLFKCPICGTSEIHELRGTYGIEMWVNRTNGVCPKCHKTVKYWDNDVLRGYSASPNGNNDDFVLAYHCEKCGLTFMTNKPPRTWRYYDWMKKDIEKCDNCKVEEAPDCWYWYPREKVQFD